VLDVDSGWKSSLRSSARKRLSAVRRSARRRLLHLQKAVSTGSKEHNSSTNDFVDGYNAKTSELSR